MFEDSQIYKIADESGKKVKFYNFDYVSQIGVLFAPITL
jgi:hypothetical protein